MNTHPWNRLMVALILSIIISLGISFATFEIRKDTDQTPQSTTLVTPFEVFISGVHTNVTTGKTTEGIAIQYGSAALNILILFIPLAILSLLVKKSQR